LRRPIVFILLFFVTGCILQNYTGFSFFVLAAAGLILVLSLIYCGNKVFINDNKYRLQKDLCFLLIILALGSARFNIAQNNVDPLESYSGHTVDIYGRVLSVQEKGENYYSLQIKGSAYRMNIGKDFSGTGEGIIESNWNRKCLVNIRGEMDNPKDLIGRNVQLTGKVELPSPSRNPGMFDYRLYLKTKGIRIILASDTHKMVVDEYSINLLSHAIAKFKYSFIDKLEKIMEPEASGLFVGMLFGDVSNISDETYEAFQKNGTAHILSVSGIHVGIVYLYINKILGAGRNKILNLTVILMLVLYAALSEYSPSVVRAVMMIIIHIVSKLTWHRYDFLCCASISALIMLIVNPYYLFNVGFQLSYLAVFCLSFLIPWANRRIDILIENLEGTVTGEKKILFVEKGLKSAVPLIAIQLGMAPLIAFHFNYFSIVSFFINIPIIGLSGMIIPLGIFLIPLSFLGGMLFGVAAVAAEILIKIMTGLNDFFFMPGVGFINAVSPSLGSILLYYAFIFFLTSELFRVLYQRRKSNIIAAIMTVIVISSLVVAVTMEENYHRSNLIFVDVGQGDCLHIRTSTGKNILIDGGGSPHYETGKKLLLPYLLKNKVKKLDLAVVTHLHDDHYLGLAQLSKNMNIDKFVTYEANQFREEKLLAETGLKKENLVYTRAGQRINLDEDVWIDILYPNSASREEYIRMIEDEKDENETSLFVKINYKGLSILMTGDVGFDGEDAIMKQYEKDEGALKADILKVGHHGSKYSTSEQFLQRVQPTVAIFQVGKNNYGHPHPDVVEKCQKRGIMIFRNDLDGAIVFHNEDKKWQIRTMLQ
jgi:competence protein ComEC